MLLVSLLLLTVQTRGAGNRPGGRAGHDRGHPRPEPRSSASTAAPSDFWANYVDWKSVRRENAALREENEHLRVQALQAGETREENARLRRLLVLKDRLPLATVAGEVIGREAGGWVRSLTVNRGRGDGISQQTPVIVPDGLVGRVVQVHRGAAVIQLLNDPASTVGAVVQRTRTAGLVEGDAGGTVRFKFMARDGASVAPGDLVVTSGPRHASSRKGLPVGRVRQDRGQGLGPLPLRGARPRGRLLPRRGGPARHRADAPRTWPRCSLGGLTRAAPARAARHRSAGVSLQSTRGRGGGIARRHPRHPAHRRPCCIALRRGPEFGCVAGFVAGLLQDAASGGLLGVQALTKALIGFGMGAARRPLRVSQPLVQVPGPRAADDRRGARALPLLQLFHFPAPFGELMLHVILPQALYNGFLGAAVLLAEAGPSRCGGTRER